MARAKSHASLHIRTGLNKSTGVLPAMKLKEKVGGPRYVTNLKMVYPEVNLILSWGISHENAGEFIRCGE